MEKKSDKYFKIINGYNTNIRHYLYDKHLKLALTILEAFEINVLNNPIFWLYFYVLLLIKGVINYYFLNLNT